MPPEFDRKHALNSFCTSLEEQLGSRRFRHWFSSSSQFTVQDSELTVQVSSPYLQKFIQQKFHSVLAGTAASCFGPEIKIRYEAGKNLTLVPAQPTETGQPVAATARTLRASGAASSLVSEDSGKPAHRRRMNDLRHFVVGASNDLAYMAVQQAIDDPNAASPIYIQSSVGNGKTHLLEGTYRELRKTFPTQQTLLITAEQFCNYFTQALSAKTLPSFRHRFRGVDSLLVDDVDFFDGKRAVQEEFLHTLKRLQEEGKQVIVTSSKHPRLLTRTSEELITRFAAGLICRIEAPDEKTRKQICENYAQRLKLKVAPGALEFIASKFRENVRELEGALNVLQTWSNMTGQRVTQTSARELLARLHRDCMRVVRLSDIEKVISETYHVSAEDLRSNSRKQSIAQPRMLAMYLARRLTQAAYSEIGQHFGGRNHSTVMSAEKRVIEQASRGATVKLGGQEWPLQELLGTLEDRIRAV